VKNIGGFKSYLILKSTSSRIDYALWIGLIVGEHTEILEEYCGG
jgi:hypothetical protein